MSDTNVKRDRALDRIGAALERQNKMFEVLSRSFVQFNGAIVPLTDLVTKLFEGFGEMETVSTGQLDAFDTEEEIEAPDAKVNFMIIPVSESSAMTAREIGYNAGYSESAGGFYISLPFNDRVKKDPNAGT